MTAARIDLAGLQNELTSFERKFEDWAGKTAGSAEAMKNEHLNILRQFQATIRSLKQQQAELEHKSQEVQKRLAMENTEIETLRADVSKIKAEQSSLPSAVADLQSQVSSLSATYDNRQQAQADEQKLQETHYRVYRQVVDTYAHSTGLSFEVSDATGRLDFIFTFIDPRDADRRFSFSIQPGPNPEDKFSVPICSPAVGEVPHLLADLNCGVIQMKDFVRMMRGHFKSIVQQEMELEKSAAQ